MALKADMPDVVDSGGARSIDLGYIMDQGVPLALGTMLMLVFLALGAGLFQQSRGLLAQIPVVGTLLQSGQGGNQVPGWEGI